MAPEVKQLTNLDLVFICISRRKLAMAHPHHNFDFNFPHFSNQRWVVFPLVTDFYAIAYAKDRLLGLRLCFHPMTIRSYHEVRWFSLIGSKFSETISRPGPQVQSATSHISQEDGSEISEESSSKARPPKSAITDLCVEGIFSYQ